MTSSLASGKTPDLGNAQSSGQAALARLSGSKLTGWITRICLGCFAPVLDKSPRSVQWSDV